MEVTGGLPSVYAKSCWRTRVEQGWAFGRGMGRCTSKMVIGGGGEGVVENRRASCSSEMTNFWCSRVEVDKAMQYEHERRKNNMRTRLSMR